ncbi:MAG: type II toxin-antitoxin system VapC family toxin [Actinomycetota bacterium]|nr:type II toxin-antitoxin system VapC family toxin [Actinomycetota bacterium]
MILVDTSIWIDHLRAGHGTLVTLLERGLVVAHPWVIGEVALGRLSQRRDVLALLAGLPQAAVATADEMLTLVEGHQLYGIGIGYVDAQLLAATQLTSDTRLWTNDKRLFAAASRLGCALDPTASVAGGL